MSSSIAVEDICVSVNAEGESFMSPPTNPCRNDSLYMPSFKFSVPTKPHVSLPNPPAGDPGNSVVMCACTSTDGNSQSLAYGACPDTCHSESFAFNVFPQHPTGSVFDLPFCYNAPTNSNAPTNGSGTNTYSFCQGGCNFYTNEVKEITCLDVESKCGDHGTCGSDGQCKCCAPDDKSCNAKGGGWSGKFCEEPPLLGNPCTPDEAFREKHGGDPACGNNGSYGLCNKSSGQCTCSLVGTQSGTHCQKDCTSDTQCGGNNRGMCVTLETVLGLPCQNTTADRTNTCLCKNGWSGTNCEIPPQDWKCSTSLDCTTASNSGGFNVTSKGVCSNGVCTCNPGNSGVACQITDITEGGPCNAKSPCPDGQFCVNVAPGVSVCSKDKNPPMSPSAIENLIQGIIGMFTTSQGLQSLIAFSLFGQVEHAIQAAGRYLFQKMASEYLTKGFIGVLTKSAAGEFIEGTAASEVEKVIGANVMQQILTKMALQDFLQLGADDAVEFATESAIDLALGPFGVIGDIQQALQVLGMILDATDFAGMNEEQLQDQVTAYGMKMQTAINSGKVARQNNISLPYEIPAESTAEFKLALKTPQNNNLKLKASSAYLGSLVNNSNGKEIIRTFQTPTKKSAADKFASAKGTVLYEVSGGNITVYNRLQKYWPIILVASLAALALIIGLPVGFHLYKKKTHNV